MTVDLPRPLVRYRDEIAQEMRAVLGERDLAIYSMMRYHLGWPENGRSTPDVTGKFFRASLCLAACTAMGGDFHPALPVAAGVELLHNFSLIHDDIEDASHLRRHRDSVWRVWGEAQAINAGDGMFALARLAVHRAADRGVSPENVLKVMALLDHASLELAEGQFEDLAFEERAAVSLDDYHVMAGRKTGAVMGAAAAAGALAADAPAEAVQSFEAFGRKLGVAFQVKDDALGLWGDPTRSGKGLDEDIKSRKKSFPLVYGLAQDDGAATDLLRSLIAQDVIDDTDAREIVSLLEGLGARAAADAQAAALVRAALDELKPLHLAGAALEDLGALAAFAQEREA